MRGRPVNKEKKTTIEAFVEDPKITPPLDTIAPEDSWEEKRQKGCLRSASETVPPRPSRPSAAPAVPVSPGTLGGRAVWPSGSVAT